MPISDEVIELVPASKSKSKLIILIVAAAVGVALAVTFLVLYLLKPNVEETPLIVNGVTVTSNELFEINEDGSPVKYAAVGNEYTVFANVSTENGASKDVDWEVRPVGAVSETEKTTGEGAFYKFKPNAQFHGSEVTITARSKKDTSKLAEVKFKVVVQGTESIDVTRYYVQGDSSSAVTVNGDAVSLPLYSTEKNNKTYIMQFEQKGKFNPSTGEYLPITSIEAENGGKTDDVTVTSSDDKVVSVYPGSEKAFTFKANKAGTAKIVITANGNNESGAFNKEITVTVKSNAELGYIDTIYVFNKPIVDQAFIESVLNAARNDIDANKLAQKLKDDATLKMNDFALTLPYNRPYADIFEHVLVSPVSLQYDASKKEIVSNWSDNMSLSSSNTNVLTVTSQKALNGGALASTENGAASCKLTFADGKIGSLPARREISVNVVAQNTAGTVKVNGKDVPTDGVATTPNGSSTLTVTYDFRMPGNVEIASVIDLGYINRSFMLDYDKSKATVTLKGDNKIIEPNTPTTIPSSAMTITKLAGSTTISTYSGVIEFTVKTSSALVDGDAFSVTYNKLGSVAEDDGSWSRAVAFNVNKVATKAFITTDEGTINKVVSGDGKFKGRYVYDDGKPDSIDIYVQNRPQDTDFISLFDVKQLADADGAFEISSVAYSNINSTVFKVSRNVLSFQGQPPADAQLRNKAATATLTIKQSGGANTVGTLTVNIYVIDAVKEFLPVTPKSAFYGRTDYKGIAFTRDEIQVRREFVTTATNYDFGKVEISYGTDAHGDDLLLNASTTGNRTIFGYDGTPLYAYENLTVTPLTDIFAFSQTKKIKFSDIRVRFKLADGDMYVGENELFGEMLCTFVRNADGIVVATSDNFAGNSLQPDVSGNLSLTANQGDRVYLLTSSVVQLSDDADDIVIVRDKSVTVYADVRHSYIEIPESYNATGSAVDGSATWFYSATINAPAVSDASGVQSHEFNVHYSGFSKKLTLTVQNKARAISAIAMYSDANCNTPLADSDLIFGKFIGKPAHYSQTVYVKVWYVADNADYMYYESALLDLPEYISVAVGGNTSSGRTYTLTPECGVHEQSDVVFRCELSLDSDAERSEGVLTVRQSNMSSTEDGISDSKNVVIDTGLKDITLIVDGTSHTLVAGQTLNIDKLFALTDRTDEQKLDFAFIFNALTDGYKGIVYNANNLHVTSNTINGLIFANGSEQDTAVIKVNLNALKTMKDAVLTFTIKDTANGASANNEFTVSVKITVTMDIFDLAFADGVNKFEIATTGGTGAQSQQIDIVYNGGDADIQPENAVKNNMTVDVVKKTGDVYAPYADGFAVEKNGANYILKVENTVLSAQDVFVRISYNGIEKYKQVTIVTRSHHIELAKEGNTISVTETGNVKTATVTVDGGTDGNKFTLAASVINDGTGMPVADKKATYAVYTDEQCNSLASHVSVSADGVITITPAVASETVYYRASYTDIDGTGATHEIMVAITYRVAVSSVVLDGIDANTMSGETITLYFANAAGYTYIDLAEFVKASNAFGLAFDNDLSVTVSTTSAALDVSGTVVRPKSIGSAVLTVTATYGSTNASKDYNVVVTGMPALSLNDARGAVDIVKDDSVTITPSYTVPNGFTATYGLTADKDGLIIAAGVAPDSKTVKATRAASSVGNYTLTAKVTYSLASGSSVKLGGSDITLVATYALTVACEYKPEFKLYCGDTEISPDGAHVIQAGGAYKLAVTNTDGHGDAVASYTASATNGIINFTAGGGKEIGFTFAQNASGSTSVKVTATVYGKTFESAAVEYTFTYGLDATAALSVSSDGGNMYVPFDADKHSQAIDFTANAFKFKYTVTGIDVATVNASDVHISVLGGTAGKVTQGTDSYYVIITTDKAGMLAVGGYVTVGSRTVYLASYEIELTAVAPEFEFTATATQIDPAGKVTLGIEQNANGFMGDYAGNVKYEIVTGGEYATLNGNVLTADSSITSNKTVTVRATVKVSNGVFANSVYTFAKEITINGAAMPTIGWNALDTEYMNIGENRKFEYTMTADYTADITASVVGTEGLMGGTDYVFDASERTLTVNDTQKTRAGGKITLKITAMITSAVHKDTEISDEIDIVITPKITATDVTIGNAANVATELADLIRIATLDGDGFFIKSSDGVIKSVAFKDQADAAVCSTDGSRITLKENFTSARSIRLTATVVMMSGNYVGKSFTCDFTVNVAVATVGDKTVAWSVGNNEYAVVDGGSDITIGEVYSGATVASIEIIATGNDAKFVTVENNGTANPTISVSKNANTYIVGSDQADHGSKSFPLTYAVTLDNGHKYYATANVDAEAVGITVSAKSEDTPLSGDTLEKYVGDTFNVELAADKGFDATIVDVEIIKPSGGADMTVSYAGNKSMFVAPAASTDGLYDVTIEYLSGGAQGTLTFNVSIKAPTSLQAYTADNTDNTDIKVGDTKTISSVWKYNAESYSNYKYAYSVTINSPDTRSLNTFFNSIKLYKSNGGYWTQIDTVESTSLNGTSVTIYFGSNRLESLSEFKLEFNVNTESEIAQCPITVSYRAYNRNSMWGQYQDISVRYNLRVINEFTVSFDADNGSLGADMPASITVTNGMQYGILPVPTREHYEFGGWYTARNGGGTPVTRETNVSLTADQTLYAKWTAKNYDVELELNGGTLNGWTGTKGSVKADGKYNIPAAGSVSRTGYDFAGWYTRLTSGDRITAGDSASGTIHTVLYARWMPKSVVVSFDTGDPAVSSPSDINGEYNGRYGSLPTVVRDHYTFIGWFTERNGGIQIADGAFISVTESDYDSANNRYSVTLYARWTTKDYNVTLDYGYAADGETENVKAEFTAPYGSEFGIHQIVIPTRDGYVFDGWYNGSTNVSDSAVTVNGDTTLTAQWKKIVTVSFVADMEGVDDPQSRTYTQGDAYGSLPELVKDGQTFLGWFTDGGTEAVKTTDTVESDATLTARWQAADHTPEESGEVDE